MTITALGIGPLKWRNILTAATSPNVGVVNTYSTAIAGTNLSPPLPQAAALGAAGAMMLLQKDIADLSDNLLTFTCYAGEQFTDGTTEKTLIVGGDSLLLQAIDVNGVIQWQVWGSASNAASALNLNGLRPRRNTIAAVGDSITALGSYGWYQPWLGHTWLNQLQVLTHQRIRYGAGNFSVSGTVIGQQLSLQLPQVLAMDPLPGACVLAGPTNDLQSVGYDFEDTQDVFKRMVARCLAVGVVPILWCPPPNDYIGSVPTATVHARTYQWNTWLRKFAAENGYPLVDAHSALAQLDGSLKSGVSGDAIHPNGYGHRLIAEKAIADGLADFFPQNSLVNTSRNTDDLSNMFNNGTINQGLFTVDTNADGVANGLSGGGSGTYSFSLVDPVASDQLMGKWQQSNVAAGGGSVLTASFLTGWSVGDVIAFSARVQSTGIEASGGWQLVAMKMDTAAGYPLPDGSGNATYLFNGISGTAWTCDIADGELYVEFEIPPQATTLQLWVQVGGTLVSPVTHRVGEVTVRNLTTGGLLT